MRTCGGSFLSKMPCGCLYVAPTNSMKKSRRPLQLFARQARQPGRPLNWYRSSVRRFTKVCVSNWMSGSQLSKLARSTNCRALLCQRVLHALKARLKGFSILCNVSPKVGDPDIVRNVREIDPEKSHQRSYFQRQRALQPEKRCIHSGRHARRGMLITPLSWTVTFSPSLPLSALLAKYVGGKDR